MENTENKTSPHTPHPWEVRPIGIGSQNDHSAYAIRQAEAPERDGWIANIPRSDEKNTRANARLIAAAPDLLNACMATRDLLAYDRTECIDAHTNAGVLDEDAQPFVDGYDAALAILDEAIHAAQVSKS